MNCFWGFIVWVHHSPLRHHLSLQVLVPFQVQVQFAGLVGFSLAAFVQQLPLCAILTSALQGNTSRPLPLSLWGDRNPPIWSNSGPYGVLVKCCPLAALPLQGDDIPPGSKGYGGHCDQFGKDCRMWECPDFFDTNHPGVQAFKYSDQVRRDPLLRLCTSADLQICGVSRCL